MQKSHYLLSLRGLDVLLDRGGTCEWDKGAQFLLVIEACSQSTEAITPLCAPSSCIHSTITAFVPSLLAFMHPLHINYKKKWTPCLSEDCRILNSLQTASHLEFCRLYDSGHQLNFSSLFKTHSLARNKPPATAKPVAGY